MNIKIPFWFTVALDVLAQHRATGEPLKQLTAKLIRARRLGSHDRKLLADAVFAWSRRKTGLDDRIHQALKTQYGAQVSKRQIDLLIVLSTCPDDISAPLMDQLPEAIRLAVAESAGPRTESDWPAWFAEGVRHEYQDEAEHVLSALHARAQPVLAVDRSYLGAVNVDEELRRYGIETTRSSILADAMVVSGREFSLTKLPKKLQEALWLMDDSSQLAARTVAASPGELVLDLCAGGGGKTRYMLQTGANIVAADISESRMRGSVERTGVAEAVHLVADGRLPPFRQKVFDWILIDAPCSGTGTLRRAPEIIARLAREDVTHFVEIQRQLILSAAPLLKPEGKLIYATCSILPEENRHMLEFVASSVPSLKPYPLRELWDSEVRVKVDKQASFIQLLPSTHGCDGFFMAAFSRNDQ